MLDIETLRAVQAVVAACTFVLVLGGTYRTTRAPYALWWSGAVLGSSLGTGLYLVDELVGAPWAVPVGHGVAVASAGLIWGATRALRGRGTPWWALLGVGAGVSTLAATDTPPEGVAAGTLWLLCGMLLFVTLAAWDLWRLSRHPRLRGRETLESARSAVTSVGIGATVVAVFYAVRIGVYLGPGPTSDFYLTWTGPMATTLLITLMLVVVTYSVTELSHLEVSSEWRQRATHDDLTGLLTRAEFLTRAEQRIDEGIERRERSVIVMADFDHFKNVNDTYGHAAGDRVLQAFGEACREVMRREDLAGRIGGEEFAMLITQADPESALLVTQRLGAAFEALQRSDGHDAPTVSYGIAVVDPRRALAASMSRADAALYRAKREGRDRAAIDADERPAH
ncbi:diguanylate cyclase [Demequina sp. NBRC 110052]|uniref:GGDEF domain-containing protein n=1 Tax=Demequina sp. NBRC 110052 TaxID=1570341 RepID=UPI000A023699|nr:GGDEF domain-containing protein [Demequina sp. NBRC 110052]